MPLRDSRPVRPRPAIGELTETQAIAALTRVAEELPEECWVTRSTETRCTIAIGAKMGKATYTKELCCLPCRIRLAMGVELS
jgi:hypothetical protein